MAIRFSVRVKAMALALAALSPLSPLSANIASVADNGFSVVHTDRIDASPDAIWKILVEPSLWWNPKYSFTGSAIYFTLDPVPGGCLCEKIPIGETKGGGVRHFTVLYVDQPRVLRLDGGLGPLQSEAVKGVMTWAMEQEEDGRTTVSLSYNVGGYIRSAVPPMAQSLDQVTGEMLQRLKAVSEGGDPDDGVYVAKPLRAAPKKAPPASEDEEAIIEETADEASPDSKGRGTTEGADIDDDPQDNSSSPENSVDDNGDADEGNDAANDASAADDAARMPRSERFDLLLEDELELAGGDNDSSDESSEAEGKETDTTEPDEPDDRESETERDDSTLLLPGTR